MPALEYINRAAIDKLMHKVTEKEEHPNGLKDWWRMHLACGMTVDLHGNDFDDQLRWRRDEPVTCVGCMKNS